MKKFAVALVALGFTTAAMAQGTDFASANTDTSGNVSLTEAQVLWPELNAEGSRRPTLT